jgi:hypothetical protein
VQLIFCHCLFICEQNEVEKEEEEEEEKPKEKQKGCGRKRKAASTNQYNDVSYLQLMYICLLPIYFQNNSPCFHVYHKHNVMDLDHLSLLICFSVFFWAYIYNGYLFRPFNWFLMFLKPCRIKLRKQLQPC